MKIPNTKHSTFTTFDRTISINTLHQRVDRIRIMEQNITHFQIPRGSGLSYTAASFGKDILVREFSSFNRILEFDRKQKTIVVESGITLQKLLEFSFNEKLFFPVLPGHPNITIGGCVAANVHGKNPLKDGSFKEHMIWIELFHPKNGTKIVEKNCELFDATCGGLGLTGIITKIKLQLYDLPSDRIIVETKSADSMIDSIKIFEKNLDAEILYSWHNGSIIKNFGKGIITVGSFSHGFHDNDIKIPKNKCLSKIQIPISFWGKLTTTLFFSLYRYMMLKHGKEEKQIFNCFFPLSGFARFFHILYGKNGFREYQILVSKNNIEDFIHDLTNLTRKEKPDLNIISLKPFRGKQKFLQFCGNGFSVAMEFANSSSTNKFLPKIDELVISYKAIPNVIKDSRLPKSVVKKCFPEYNEFCEILKKIDPDRVFRSHLSNQLGL